MFKKKKEEIKKPLETVDYSIWEKDFSFLNAIIEQKKTISTEFMLKPMDEQHENSNIPKNLTDENVFPIIKQIIQETLNAISENYKNFLVNKYFKNEEEFVFFITERLTFDILGNTINRNYDKMIRKMKRDAVIKTATELNKK